MTPFSFLGFNADAWTIVGTVQLAVESSVQIKQYC